MRNFERESLLVLQAHLHSVMKAAIDGKLQKRKAIEVLHALLQREEAPWWAERYKRHKWVSRPLTPHLLRRPEDSNFTRAMWRMLKMSKVKFESANPNKIGPTIYQHLVDSDLLQYCPSLEAFEYYADPENQKVRKKLWDRTGYWVYAFRDAVVSSRPTHNIMVPGIYFDPLTGQIHRKWKPLKDIAETKFKVIYRVPF